MQRWHRAQLVMAIAATGALPLSGGLVATSPTDSDEVDGADDVVVEGSFQTAFGCAEDWTLDCDEAQLHPDDSGDIFTLTQTVPAGEHEYHIVVGGDRENALGDPNNAGDEYIRLNFAADTEVTFTYDRENDSTWLEIPELPGEYTDDDADLVGEPFRSQGPSENFYFALTDRFADGDPSNNQGGIDGERTDHGYDPTDAGFYHGGDIQGLRDNLDYIAGLGTTALWITPPFVNLPVQGIGDAVSAGFHGYWITDFTSVDPHLGTTEDLTALVEEANDMGISVYLDIITNHTADLIDYEEGDYDYIPIADEPYRDAEGNVIDLSELAGEDEDQWPELDPEESFPYTPTRNEDAPEVVPEVLNDVTLYHNRGNSTWSGESVTFGDFLGLDDLMTEHPVVVDTMVEVYQAWVDIGIDGFRIDTVKHVNPEFWEEFSTRISEYADDQGREDFFLFGEVYDSDARLLSPYVRNTDMDSVQDFAYQSAATNYARGYPADGLSALFGADGYYTTPESAAVDLPTFLGNHDTGRIGYAVGPEDDGVERSALAHSLMYFSRGQPVVYYGDEQGFAEEDNEEDTHARQTMFGTQVDEYAEQELLDGTPFGEEPHFDQDSPLYNHIGELADLRSDHPEFATGAQYELYSESGPGPYVLARVDRDDQVEHIAAVNSTTDEHTVTFTTLTDDATYTPIFGDHPATSSGAEGEITLTLPPLSSVALEADTTVTARGAGELEMAEPGAELSDLAPVTATVPDNSWGETSFSYRQVGEEEYTALGTAENDNAEVFHDVGEYPVGTVVEYRAVHVDADGNRSANSTFGVVGVDLSRGDTAAELVTVPGTHQLDMGCGGDWAPECEASALDHDSATGMYAGTFNLPEGDYEYKVAVGETWDENYGADGVVDGENIAYSHDGGDVTFVYDPDTNLVTSSAEAPIVTLTGTFQEAFGCETAWSENCPAPMLQGPDIDGIYSWTTADVPSGDHEVSVVHNLSGDTYGEDGQLDGEPYSLAVSDDDVVNFEYNADTNMLDISVEEASDEADDGRATDSDPTTNNGPSDDAPNDGDRPDEGDDAGDSEAGGPESDSEAGTLSGTPTAPGDDDESGPDSGGDGATDSQSQDDNDMGAGAAMPLRTLDFDATDSTDIGSDGSADADEAANTADLADTGPSGIVPLVLLALIGIAGGTALLYLRGRGNK